MSGVVPALAASKHPNAKTILIIFAWRIVLTPRLGLRTHRSVIPVWVRSNTNILELSVVDKTEPSRGPAFR